MDVGSESRSYTSCSACSIFCVCVVYPLNNNKRRLELFKTRENKYCIHKLSCIDYADYTPQLERVQVYSVCENKRILYLEQHDTACGIHISIPF